MSPWSTWSAETPMRQLHQEPGWGNPHREGAPVGEATKHREHLNRAEIGKPSREGRGRGNRERPWPGQRGLLGTSWQSLCQQCTLPIPPPFGKGSSLQEQNLPSVPGPLCSQKGRHDTQVPTGWDGLHSPFPHPKTSMGLTHTLLYRQHFPEVSSEQCTLYKSPCKPQLTSPGESGSVSCVEPLSWWTWARVGGLQSKAPEWREGDHHKCICPRRPSQFSLQPTLSSTLCLHSSLPQDNSHSSLIQSPCVSATWGDKSTAQKYGSREMTEFSFHTDELCLSSWKAGIPLPPPTSCGPVTGSTTGRHSEAYVPWDETLPRNVEMGGNDLGVTRLSGERAQQRSQSPQEEEHVCLRLRLRHSQGYRTNKPTGAEAPHQGPG